MDDQQLLDTGQVIVVIRFVLSSLPNGVAIISAVLRTQVDILRWLSKQISDSFSLVQSYSSATIRIFLVAPLARCETRLK